MATRNSSTVDFVDQFDKFCWELLLKLKLSQTDIAAPLENADFLSYKPPEISEGSLVGKYVNFQMNCHE